MTILELLKESVERLKLSHDEYIIEELLPDMIVLLEKGYPAYNDVKVIADKYPDCDLIDDVPDYHHIDNVFGECVEVDYEQMFKELFVKCGHLINENGRLKDKLHEYTGDGYEIDFYKDVKVGNVDNVGVIGIGEMVDVTIKREHEPIDWRIAEVNLGDFDEDFKSWHSAFLQSLANKNK